MEHQAAQYPVLETQKITKSFAGNTVLRDVDMALHSGKVTALIGENGAGKSTLMKIIAGIHNAEKGSVLLDGSPVKVTSTREAQSLGISIILQELNLIPNLSVAENIYLGREPSGFMGLVNKSQMHKNTRYYLDKLNLNISPDTRVENLKVAQQQLVEIARALSFDARILIMDEPTSAIADKEIEILYRVIEEFKQNGGAVVYISHKLEELYRIADDIYVLRDGQVTESGSLSGFSKDYIVRKMVGREPSQFFIKKEAKVEENKVFEVRDFNLKLPNTTGRYTISNVNFHLNKGEILGLFGLMGAGRSELLEAIFGLHNNYTSGEIWIDGEKAKIKNVSDAIKAGLALIPEDRKTQGLILPMSVTKNMTLACLNQMFKLPFINSASETRLARRYKEELGIKTNGLHQPVKYLSGGNQQKVVLGKWLATNPKILLLDEPTRGIDINAKHEIYKMINNLVQEGMSIILVSSELPEVLALSDRIMVLSDTQIQANIPAQDANEEKIMSAAIPTL